MQLFSYPVCFRVMSRQHNFLIPHAVTLICKKPAPQLLLKKMRITAFDVCSSGVNTMEKKLAEYKCDTNEAISLKLGMFMLHYICLVNEYDNMYACIDSILWNLLLISHLNCLKLVVFSSQFASQRMLMMMALHSIPSTATSFLEMSEYFL